MCQENLHVTLLPVPGARLCLAAVQERGLSLSSLKGASSESCFGTTMQILGCNFLAGMLLSSPDSEAKSLPSWQEYWKPLGFFSGSVRAGLDSGTSHLAAPSEEASGCWLV